MIEMDLVDRIEYCIGGDWSVNELLCIKCPKCGMETVEVITYPDMTLYYHDGGEPNLLTLCTIHKGAEHLTIREIPWFRVQPTAF